MRRLSSMWLLGMLLAMGRSSAQDFVLAQIRLLEPSLDISIIQQLPRDPCVLAGNSFSCDGLASGARGRRGVGVDALGNFYYLSVEHIAIGGEPFCDFGGGFTDVYEVKRLTPNGVQVVARIPMCASHVCAANGSVASQDTHLLNLTSDPVNGYLYLAVNASTYLSTGPGICPETGKEANVIVRISGLPTVRDVVPEGPAGPEGPPGPQGLPGPPGRDADPSAILSLQQQLLEQQIQINALRTLLQQIENLPTIRTLLEKVQQLEQANP